MYVDKAEIWMMRALRCWIVQPLVQLPSSRCAMRDEVEGKASMMVQFAGQFEGSDFGLCIVDSCCRDIRCQLASKERDWQTLPLIAHSRDGKSDRCNECICDAR